MPRLRDAEHAFRLITYASRQPFVCRFCRAQASRQFHTSNSRQSFLKTMRESIFGSKNSKEAERKREEKVQEQALRDADGDLQTITDKKGKTYTVAAVVDPSVNSEYIMSTNWNGLRRIGSKEWIQRNKDPGDKYVGFMPEKRVKLSDIQWASLLHHITVEVLALKGANRSVHDICSPRSNETKPWAETSRTTITSDESTGEMSLRFRTDESQERILAAIPKTGSEATVSGQQSSGESSEQGTEESIEEQESEKRDLEAMSFANEIKGAAAPAGFKQYSTGTPWTAIRLREPMIKLVILKRIMQLTGHRIPDPTVSSANTLADLYNALKAKEPPEKLAETDEMKRLNANAPNVVVHSKRRTLIHKETDIGRWKVIKHELIARDLPVTGTRWADAKPRIGVEPHRR